MQGQVRALPGQLRGAAAVGAGGRPLYGCSYMGCVRRCFGRRSRRRLANVITLRRTRVIDFTHLRHFLCFCQIDWPVESLQGPPAVLRACRPRHRQRARRLTRAACAGTGVRCRAGVAVPGGGRPVGGLGLRAGVQRAAALAPEGSAFLFAQTLSPPPSLGPPLTPEARRTTPVPAPAPEAASPGAVHTALPGAARALGVLGGKTAVRCGKAGTLRVINRQKRSSHQGTCVLRAKIPCHGTGKCHRLTWLIGK